MYSECNEKGRGKKTYKGLHQIYLIHLQVSLVKRLNLFFHYMSFSTVLHGSNITSELLCIDVKYFSNESYVFYQKLLNYGAASVCVF